MHAERVHTRTGAETRKLERASLHRRRAGATLAQSGDGRLRVVSEEAQAAIQPWVPQLQSRLKCQRSCQELTVRLLQLTQPATCQ